MTVPVSVRLFALKSKSNLMPPIRLEGFVHRGNARAPRLREFAQLPAVPLPQCAKLKRALIHPLHRETDHLRRGFEIQLLLNMRPVAFDGLHAQIKVFSDLAGAVALADELEHPPARDPKARPLATCLARIFRRSPCASFCLRASPRRKSGRSRCAVSRW